MRRFCTAFDSNYLFKGIALHRSLVRHAPGSELWVLCFDQATERVLKALALPDLVVLPLEALEASEPRLPAAKADRSRVEYYFTCTPALIEHVLTHTAGGGPVTYLDADLYFCSSAAPLLEEERQASVTIIGHRFPAAYRHLEQYGIYNVGWLTFADDRPARECLAWWRDRCIEWCYDRLEDGKYADQKYLDDWPTRFENVHVLAHAGAGVAPWNVADVSLAAGSAGVRVGDVPLVFYHFHAFKRVLSWLYDPGLSRYGGHMTPVLRDGVYLPYLAELRAIERELGRSVPDLPRGWGTSRGLGLRGLVTQALRRQLLVAP